MNAPPTDVLHVQHGPTWLTPPQAAVTLGCTPKELLRLVGDRKLQVHQLPDGTLVISSTDLAALRTPVPASEAVGLITNLFSQDNTMQNALETSAAALTLVPLQQLAAAPDVFSKIDELIEETRAKLERLPMWLGVRDVKRVFGIDNRRLQELVLDGFVRKAKLGATLQSKTLYSAADLDEVLSRLAAGKPPRSALRKGVNDAA